MAASNMREQGTKTREKVRKKLATKPRRVDDIAHRCGLTPGMARKHLHALVHDGIAVMTKQSHALMFSKAPKTALLADGHIQACGNGGSSPEDCSPECTKAQRSAAK